MADYTSQKTLKTHQLTFDIFVVGGGINGAGIARDAAGRGFQVGLCEKGDFASATSSASTKLIHGGLRYLEHYEFGLVRKALLERETLLRNAAHIISPLRFVLPHDEHQRPAWMLRLGLFLYDHLSKRKRLAGSKAVDLRSSREGAPLKASYKKGFEYSDCWVDDARLVILNLIDAKEKGATVFPRTKFLSAERSDGNSEWRITLQNQTGELKTVTARAIVNAAGPWVSTVSDSIDGGVAPAKPSLRLVKGSHVIVPKIYDGEHAYIFQNADGRIQFAIPYQSEFTLLGTTDIAFDGDIENFEASEAEREYIIRMTNAYFEKSLSVDDIRHHYSGVRPLYDDSAGKSASKVTRDYVFELEGSGKTAPILSIYGGKITTYRVLAEEALAALMPAVGGKREPWTAHAPLPGGDMPDADFDSFLADRRLAYPWIDQPTLRRLARQYGTRMDRIIKDAAGLDDLGRSFGSGLTEAEIEYLVAEEWAYSVEDVLWRRSKLGLHLTDDECQALKIYWNERDITGQDS